MLTFYLPCIYTVVRVYNCIHTYIHTYIQMIASSSAYWMISHHPIIEATSCIIAAHSYIRVCIMVVAEERGQGRERLTLSAASRLAPLSRSIFITSTSPLLAEQMRAVRSCYQRQTHTQCEKETSGWMVPHTTMQRDDIVHRYMYVCMYVHMYIYEEYEAMFMFFN